MTWVDAVPIVLILAYLVLGYFTGAFRRLISLVSVYVACFSATNMGIQTGGIIQQSSSLETPDARIYGFFGILIAVILLIDGAAQLVHKQIQIEAVVLNRTLGIAAGLVTAVLLSVLVTYELEAAGNPIGGGQLDSVQLRIRDAIQGSKVAVPLTDALKKPVVFIFQPVLPPDPQIYFSFANLA